MPVLDHWHPAVLSRSLKNKPVAVRLAGHDLVLFRTSTGQPAALEEQCPHRRMRLSLGSVVGDRLLCKYHGWTFGADGCGESPGTPKLHTCAVAYDVREEHGAVWVKPPGVPAEFPRFDLAGYHPMGVLDHTAQAPLELVVDNFCEIEHTPTTHGLFGYPLERMHEVKVKFEATDTSVRVLNVGPTKPVPWFLRLVLGVRNSDAFIDDWTTHFSPVYSIYDHEWGDVDTGRRGRIGWRLFIFFTPVADAETRITTFAYARSTYPGPQGGLRLGKWIMRHLVDKEIQLDVGVLAGLASHDPTLNGMKLSRFDRPLGLNRERIRRIYRGEPAERLSLVADERPDIVRLHLGDHGDRHQNGVVKAVNDH